MRRLSQDRFHDGADDGRQKGPWLLARQTQGSISRTPVRKRRVVPVDHTREPRLLLLLLLRLESSNAYGFLHAHGQASSLNVTCQGVGTWLGCPLGSRESLAQDHHTTWSISYQLG